MDPYPADFPVVSQDDITLIYNLTISVRDKKPRKRWYMYSRTQSSKINIK
jgi:hypothetical protein